MSRGKAPVAGNLPARSSKPALLDDAVEPRVPSLPPKWDTSPNYSDWFPGDLVLLSASRWSLSSKAIVGAQRLLRYSKEHAAWTHAAVYADKGEVVEAVTSPGVRNAPLGKTLQRRSADVRRFAKVTSRAEGQRVVAAAARLVGLKYDWETIREIALAAAGRAIGRSSDKDDETQAEVRNQYICSTLYEYAVLDAFDAPIRETSNGEPATVPAALAESEKMRRTSAGWRKTEKPAAGTIGAGRRPKRARTARRESA